MKRALSETDGWIEVKEAELKYPDGSLARRVWENKNTGSRIIDRYNMVGDVIFTKRND